MLSLGLALSGLLLDPQAGDPLYSSTPSSLLGGHEVIMIEAAFSPDQEVPLHYHPGEEVAHIIAGDDRAGGHRTGGGRLVHRYFGSGQRIGFRFRRGVGLGLRLRRRLGGRRVHRRVHR